jgi:23S rRNA (cytidine1920-2'-O)/16S rRNA (cytidine1409-2'-O)-methyltransferase
MAERLDKAMAVRGLASSRERAQGLIAAGLVVVGGKSAEKASQPVEDDVEIEVTGEILPYVGKGGLKMEAALKHFRLNVRGLTCLDVGASTGGFTDCLLQRGAVKVVAVDVGHGQLAASLKSDPRVELREGLNARSLTPDQFEYLFDFAAIDVSFISLTLVLPAVSPLVRPEGYILALVKPEFEAGREAVGARGIVRSAQARKKALEKITAFAKKELGLELKGTMHSPVTGGNKEYIACFKTPANQHMGERGVTSDDKRQSTGSMIPE